MDSENANNDHVSMMWCMPASSSRTPSESALPRYLQKSLMQCLLQSLMQSLMQMPAWARATQVLEVPRWVQVNQQPQLVLPLNLQCSVCRLAGSLSVVEEGPPLVAATGRRWRAEPHELEAANWPARPETDIASCPLESQDPWVAKLLQGLAAKKVQGMGLRATAAAKPRMILSPESVSTWLALSRAVDCFP